LLLLLERGGGREGVRIRSFAARDAVVWELPLLLLLLLKLLLVLLLDLLEHLIVVRRFVLSSCELEAGLLSPGLLLLLLLLKLLLLLPRLLCRGAPKGWLIRLLGDLGERPFAGQGQLHLHPLGLVGFGGGLTRCWECCGSCCSELFLLLLLLLVELQASCCRRVGGCEGRVVPLRLAIVAKGAV